MSNRSRPREHLEKRNQTDGTLIPEKAAESRQLPWGRVALVNQSQFFLFSSAFATASPTPLSGQTMECTCCIRRATPRTPERPDQPHSRRWAEELVERPIMEILEKMQSP